MTGPLPRWWARFRTWPLWAQGVAGLIVVSVIVGPFIDDPKPRVDADAGTTTTSEDTTTTSDPDTTTTERASTTTTADQVSTTDPQASGITGFGATRVDWNATHKEAPGYTPGSAYLPLIDGDQPQYAAVCCDERIFSYTMFFSGDFPMDFVRQQVQQEFPADATAGPMTDLGECSTQEWRSPSIEAALEGDYIPLVAYFAPDPTYPPDEQHVQAIFGITVPGDENIC